MIRSVHENIPTTTPPILYLFFKLLWELFCGIIVYSSHANNTTQLFFPIFIRSIHIVLFYLDKYFFKLNIFSQTGRGTKHSFVPQICRDKGKYYNIFLRFQSPLLFLSPLFCYWLWKVVNLLYLCSTDLHHHGSVSLFVHTVKGPNLFFVPASSMVKRWGLWSRSCILCFFGFDGSGGFFVASLAWTARCNCECELPYRLIAV